MKTIIAFIFLITFSVNGFEQTKVIAESAEQVSPLLNGQKVPDLKVNTATGENLKLTQVLNKKTVLFFYRGGWCPYCNTQMGQLKKLESDLLGLGYQLVGVSTDSPEMLKNSVKEMNLPYQLISDFDSSISQAFGLAFFASEKVTTRYVSKMDLQNPLQKNLQGQERLVLPVPAIYLIDEKGLVQFSYVNPNFKVRLPAELLLAAAKVY